MIEKFWMCYAEHGQSPTVVHTTQATAQLEAERIARANQAKGVVGCVFVLEAVEAVYQPVAPLVWETLT